MTTLTPPIPKNITPLAPSQEGFSLTARPSGVYVLTLYDNTLMTRDDTHDFVAALHEKIAEIKKLRDNNSLRFKVIIDFALKENISESFNPSCFNELHKLRTAFEKEFGAFELVDTHQKTQGLLEKYNQMLPASHTLTIGNSIDGVIKKILLPVDIQRHSTLANTLVLRTEKFSNGIPEKHDAKSSLSQSITPIIAAIKDFVERKKEKSDPNRNLIVDFSNASYLNPAIWHELCASAKTANQRHDTLYVVANENNCRQLKANPSYASGNPEVYTSMEDAEKAITAKKTKGI